MSTSEIGFKKMNWLPKPSVWEQMELAREKRREMIAEFTERSQNLADAFGTVFTNQINGNVDNVARTAADRIIAEGQARAAEIVDKLA